MKNTEYIPPLSYNGHFLFSALQSLDIVFEPDQRTIKNEEHHLQVINFIFSTASRILQSLTIFIIFKPKSILGLAPPFFRKGSNLNCLEQPIIHGPGEQKEHVEYIGTCKGEGRRQ